MIGTKRYETPPDYFRKRWERHRFTVDAFASDANALVRPCGLDDADGVWCAQHDRALGRYYTEETNGLNPEHYKPGDRVWGNPPYDYSLLATVKLARELAMDGGVLWDLLLPMSGATRWFMRYVWNDDACHWRDGVEAHYVGRVPFLLDGKPPLDKHGKPQSSRQENLQVTFHARGKA